jgi:AraC-like DNA-binding protein
LLNALGRDLFDGTWLVYIPAILMSALLFFLGYVAAHTKVPVETVSPEETPETDTATTQETEELIHKISVVLIEEKLFANPDLTVQDLATTVGSNRTYVSNCINRRTGLSFSQYIARFRVEYAQTVLCDRHYTSDHEAITAAVALSGFSSDQSFYRVFKELTDLTPLQYRHKNLK